MARNATRLFLPALLLALAVLVAACTTPEIIRETPQPSPTATQTLVPVETQVAPTGTAIINSPRRQIERITLATEVAEDGTPADERSAIPEAAERFFLCVQVRDVEQGSRFQAIWFEGGEIIGRSEKLALEDAADPVWIALQYQPIAKLNPAREHAVELVVDDEPIERFVFRVGIGDASDAVAAVGFTTGFDALGKAIDPQSRFHVDTPQLTLRVRISNQVDPAGMLFSTLWFRDDTQIAQRAPDPPSTDATQATPTPDPRRIAFTFAPSSPLPPGNYRVALLLNGTEVRSISFTLTDEVLPTATPAPASTPTAQPDDAADGDEDTSVSDADVVDIVVASRVNPTTQAALDGPLFSWDGAPDSVASLWVSISVRNVQRSDTLEIVVLQDDEFYGSVTLTETTLESGWLAGRVELDTPSSGEAPITYTFSARVNGAQTLDTALELSSE